MAIVQRGRDGIDLDCLFAQVLIEEARVDVTPICGNISPASARSRWKRRLVSRSGDETTLRILTRNTGMVCDATIQTPGGRVRYDGDARIDGVPGTAAPIKIKFLDTAGSVCGKLLPTGNATDELEGDFGKLRVTCIDNGMPVVIVAASALGRTGYESHDALNADAELKARLEAIRLRAGSGDGPRRRLPQGRPEDDAGVRTRARGQRLHPDVHTRTTATRRSASSAR